MAKKTSITDMPHEPQNGKKDEDPFEIVAYEDGLVEFIRGTDTPITIALQGEWGSGKTSLMNGLKVKLCEGPDAKFIPIWLNAWEFALLKDSETALSQIVIELVQKISDKAGITPKVTKKLLKDFFLSGVKIAANVADKGFISDIADFFLSSEESMATIKELHDKLEKTIAKAIDREKKKFIFFIDDLDRIDPSVAVELLELLKNIFTLEHCVFILAIDYDVIIKGLKPKFGEHTRENDREFRSFFDKIIQVPFLMPIGNYEIGGFLKNQLEAIEYLNAETKANKRLTDNIAQAVECTLGHNPRSIKRLLNYLSLNSHINRKISGEDKLDEPTELYINFALVCLQIAYPKIYSQLYAYPDFPHWDEPFATKQGLPQLDEAAKQRLSATPEFNEQWEQTLFRICETDDYLKQNALKISTLLNSMAREIEAETEKAESNSADNLGPVGCFIQKIIHLSAITNLEVKDKQEIQYNVPNLLITNFKRFQRLYEDTFHLKPEQTIKKVTNRLQFKIGEVTHFDITTRPVNGNIELQIYHDVYPGCRANPPTIQQRFTEKGKEAWEAYEKIQDAYAKKVGEYVNEKNTCYAGPKLIEETNGNYKGSLNFGLYFQVILPSVEAFEDDKVLVPIVEMVNAMYAAEIALVKLAEKWLDEGRLNAISNSVTSKTALKSWQIMPGERRMDCGGIIPNRDIWIGLYIFESGTDPENLKWPCKIFLSAPPDVWGLLREKIREEYQISDSDEIPNKKKWGRIEPTIAIIDGENDKVVDKLVEVYHFMKGLEA